MSLSLRVKGLLISPNHEVIIVPRVLSCSVFPSPFPEVLHLFEHPPPCPGAGETAPPCASPNLAHSVPWPHSWSRVGCVELHQGIRVALRLGLEHWDISRWWGGACETSDGFGFFVTMRRTYPLPVIPILLSLGL